ncbi:MAG: metallophosphoesterase [Clostridia bacterium]
MSKTKKRILIAIGVVLSTLLVLLATMLPFAWPKKGISNDEAWLKTDVYSLDNTVVIEKSADRDFVILNMTDIQLNDALDIGRRAYTEQTIRQLVEEVKPDLITMTGDQVWAAPFKRESLKYLIALMESFKLPWAPVMGNHDGEGNADAMWCADRYAEAEYCVFKKGPNNIKGVGNYVINIKENDKIIHSMVMLDSGSNAYYPELDKTGYDNIGVEKQDWYEWAIEGARAVSGNANLESSLFFHIALPEFQTAYDEWVAGGCDPKLGFGENREKCCPAPINSGFFERIKAVGSTKNIIIGHDHVNNSSVLYQGVRLTYGMKTGDRCYADDDMNGGTVITMNSQGALSIAHHYVNIK